MKRRLTRIAGFTLLPVILTMTLIAAIAFLLNRDNGMNAEMVAIQTNVDRARYAAEAGLQAVNANMQDNNCSGLYYNILVPLTNSNFGGASYKAYANPGFGWPVTLVSTGTYNGTSVTLTRNNVIVYKTSPDTYTLQPGPATSYDTYVNPALPNLNYGAATTLQVGSGVGESLLKFDFSILPAGSKIVQYYSGGTLQPGATLSLYQSNKPGSGSALISAHLITRSWTQGTGISPANGATWNTYDGISAWSSPGIGYDPKPLATIPYANVITWNNWDISDAVIAWMGNDYPNYGIWIKNFSGLWQNVTYLSSDNSNVSQRPKITVNYLLPCGSTGPTNTPVTNSVTLSATADTYVDLKNMTTNYGSIPSLVLGGDTSKGNLFNGFLAFNVLATVPPNVTITSAKLRLYEEGKGAGGVLTLEVHRLTKAWNEAQITGIKATTLVNWTNIGGDYDAKVVSSAVISNGGGVWDTWDITPLVQEWVDGVSPDYGLILIRQAGSAGNPHTLHTSREGSLNTPELVITYQ